MSEIERYHIPSAQDIEIREDRERQLLSSALISGTVGIGSAVATYFLTKNLVVDEVVKINGDDTPPETMLHPIFEMVTFMPRVLPSYLVGGVAYIGLRQMAKDLSSARLVRKRLNEDLSIRQPVLNAIDIIRRQNTPLE